MSSLDKSGDILSALRRIIRASDIYSRYLSRTTGLTVPQLLILQSLRESGETSVGTIARRVNLSHATVTTILDRLERRGLIRRTRSQVDKRRVHASVNAEGLALIEGTAVPLQNHFIERLQSLEDWEQNMILSGFQRVAQMMELGQLDGLPLIPADAPKVGDDGTTETF